MNNNTSSFAMFLLFLLFLTLKLCHVIDWSWWWIFSPFWSMGLLVIILFLIIFIKYREDNK